MNRSFTIQVDFTDDWFEADIDPDVWEDATERFLSITHASEVCLNHMCWVNFDVGNVHLQTLTELGDEMEAEIQMIIDHFRGSKH